MYNPIQIEKNLKFHIPTEEIIVLIASLFLDLDNASAFFSKYTIQIL